ncbi:hypothetical protein M0R45_022369 [Rubus argutus]|uniref:Uncharacterized protein n=1 Tax=Rubus argutus TaxID=59490 RepID=A0AAW1XFU4_RUBAR
MSLASWKLAGGALPLTSVGENRLPTKPSAMTTTRKRALPLQVRSEEKQESVPPKALDVSRRDVMLSLPTATVAALTLFSVGPAEARIVKPEIRRKIQEKLEMLREKAGVSKPKTNDGKESSPLSEDKTLLSSPPAPLPSPQGSPIVPPVDALLP